MKNVLNIFIKYPEPGKVKTRLANEIGSEEACKIYSGFIKNLCQLHSNKAYDLALFYTPADKAEDIKALVKPWVTGEVAFHPQSEGDLGKRMEGSFEVLCPKYEKVVGIGSDLPNLHSDVIEKAFKTLDEEDVVLGPSEDGGFYLLGMRAPHDIFANITWSTETVLNEQVRNIENNELTYALLEKRFDIDTKADLDRL